MSDPALHQLVELMRTLRCADCAYFVSNECKRFPPTKYDKVTTSYMQACGEHQRATQLRVQLFRKDKE